MAFRDTALGQSLDDALAMLTTREDQPFAISDVQRNAIWQAYERSMQSALTDVPPEHVAFVDAGVSAADKDDPFGLPAYRYVDGKWTIVIKDAKLRMAAPGALSATAVKDMHVDYLQIDAVDAPDQAGAAGGRGKRGRQA